MPGAVGMKAGHETQKHISVDRTERVSICLRDLLITDV